MILILKIGSNRYENGEAQCNTIKSGDECGTQTDLMSVCIYVVYSSIMNLIYLWLQIFDTNDTYQLKMTLSRSTIDEGPTLSTEKAASISFWTRKKEEVQTKEESV